MTRREIGPGQQLITAIGSIPGALVWFWLFLGPPHLDWHLRARWGLTLAQTVAVLWAISALALFAQRRRATPDPRVLVMVGIGDVLAALALLLIGVEGGWWVPLVVAALALFLSAAIVAARALRPPPAVPVPPPLPADAAALARRRVRHYDVAFGAGWAAIGLVWLYLQLVHARVLSEDGALFMFPALVGMVVWGYLYAWALGEWFRDRSVPESVRGQWAMAMIAGGVIGVSVYYAEVLRPRLLRGPVAPPTAPPPLV